MLIVELLRTSCQPKQTLGNLSIDGKEICKTLELPWLENKRRVSCIPEGEYTVVKRNSPKYKNHFHILEVPNRDWILIHHGNFYTDILGCILVGENHVDINRDGLLDVTNSVATMKKLNTIFPDKFKLIVKS